ncbi:hypothetical protein DH2020_011601 [Rehmannia glutinosa]|uniref:Uncharacterized protein n=1 Tax=Rehmannia glutinosa TaxID=99300 RepID=A0ABR0XDU1_REHGL
MHVTLNAKNWKLISPVHTILRYVAGAAPAAGAAAQPSPDPTDDRRAQPPAPSARPKSHDSLRRVLSRQIRGLQARRAGFLRRAVDHRTGAISPVDRRLAADYRVPPHLHGVEHPVRVARGGYSSRLPHWRSRRSVAGTVPPSSGDDVRRDVGRKMERLAEILEKADQLRVKTSNELGGAVDAAAGAEFLVAAAELHFGIRGWELRKTAKQEIIN